MEGLKKGAKVTCAIIAELNNTARYDVFSLDQILAPAISGRTFVWHMTCWKHHIDVSQARNKNSTENRTSNISIDNNRETLQVHTLPTITRPTITFFVGTPLKLVAKSRTLWFLKNVPNKECLTYTRVLCKLSISAWRTVECKMSHLIGVLLFVSTIYL